jgi:amino acid adenylation domain-containing protein
MENSSTQLISPRLSVSDRPLRLSLSQQEIWLDHMAWPGSPHLHVGGAGFLEGLLDVKLLEQSLQVLVSEADALRIVPLADGTQVVLDAVVPQLTYVDISEHPSPREYLSETWSKEIAKPFPFDGTLPWRIILYRISPNLHGISLYYHHLVMDGLGTSLVLKRWAEIHNQMTLGIFPILPTSSGSYRSFVEDSRIYQQSESFLKDGEYWARQLPDVPPQIVQQRTTSQGAWKLPATHLVCKAIDREKYRHIEGTASGMGCTVFALFLAAICIYFSKTSGSQQIVVGIPSLNRPGRKFKETLGMFVGVMAIPVVVEPQVTVRQLLVRVSTTIRGALRHPRFPLSEVVKRLGLARTGRTSVFDLLLSFERQDYKLAFGDARITGSRQNFAGVSRYPCSVTVCEFNSEEDVEVILEASSACFEVGEAQLLWDRLVGVVHQLADQPDACVSEIAAVPQSELALLTRSLQPGAYSVASLMPYLQRFDQWVRTTPRAIALRWDQGQMDYATTERTAHQLALRLHALGVGRDDVVALAIERSPDMVIAMLGINKAGAAFLPLDPDAPPARLAEILSESRASALILKSATVARLGGLHKHALLIDQPMASLADADLPIPAPEDLAYVLFTSGSTGKPKGVAVEHRALAARLNWLIEVWGINSKDCGGQGTQATFDPSLVEWCLPLAVGASIALPPPGRLLPETLAEFAVRHGVTFMAFVPSTLSRFLDAAVQLPGLALRVACCGGEVLPPELVRRYLQGTKAQLFNVYGPTEATIFATAWQVVDTKSDDALPIGAAISGARIYVLDAQRQPLPIGAAGEIYIGGQGVARGYLHRPDLTVHAFFEDPFSPGGRMYKTGDRGWLSADGTVHFNGRLDRQVKLRGYRIELGEIEAALAGVVGVSAAAAKLVERDGKAEICAWITGDPGLNSSVALKVLRQRLPAYMVPSVVSVLPQMPESGTGKIDYAKLPLPDAPSVRGIGRSPENELERELLNLWQQALKAPSLTVEDNFFDAGGDSLAAISVLTGIEALVGRRVPM